MPVQVKVSRGVQVEGRKLTAEEQESIKSQIAEKEAMVRASDQFGDGDYSHAVPQEVSINKDKAKEGAQKLRAVLAREAPERVSDPAKRNQIMARRKALLEKFQDYLETWQDLGAIRMESPEYKAAFKKAQSRYKVEHHISEWKELGKMLEPEDSSINDLDQYRKDR